MAIVAASEGVRIGSPAHLLRSWLPSDVPDDVPARFMRAWGEWHTAHADAIVDSGSPLGANVRVTSDQTEAVGNQLVAWMLVEAGSAEDAAAMFSRHPHVLLLPGNAVDVMELLPVPTG